MDGLPDALDGFKGVKGANKLTPCSRLAQPTGAQVKTANRTE